MVHGCACNVRGISVLENAFLVFASVFYPASNCNDPYQIIQVFNTFDKV